MSSLRLVRGPGGHALLCVVAWSGAVGAARLHHNLVLLDSMRRYQGVTVGMLVLLGRCPGQEISAYFDIIVG